MKKTNKLISILLVLVMLLSMAPLTVLAAETPPTVEIGGITYYELDSADDLDWFAAQVNGGNTSINAAITKDITYNSGTMSASSAGARVWTPVGTYEMPFEGIINGNGYTISGLYSKDPESPILAFVAYSVKATIVNVALTNFYFESTHGLVAGLASYAAGSTIHNCYAQGSIYAKDAGAAAAGICAAVYGHSKTKILNCLSDVALKVDDPSDFTVSGISVKNYIGGIICTGDKNNPVLIQKTVYITDRYNGTVYDENNSLASHFEIYDSEGMPASKLATGEIAYILGSGWGQKLGTDSIPRIGDSNVVNYGYVSCDADAQKVYTNSATNPNYPEHYDSETDSDSACDFCGTNLHTHSFTYSASGDTITAVCANADGNCPDPEGTLTILPPADLYVDGTPKEATVENNLPDGSAAVGDITYSTASGTAPFIAGTHSARVTVGGATATLKFTLLNYHAMVTDKDGNELSGSPYKTLADAITAAEGSEGSTVTLLDRIITLSETQNIDSGKFTLDLNGKKLINKNDRVLYINKEADLTIKDSGEGGTIETQYESLDCIENFGKLTVESGIIKGDAGIRNHGVLYFNDGTVEADFYAAITNYSSGSVYVYDGVLKGGENSPAVDNNGTLYIYDGEIKGITNVNTVYISGGTIDRDDYAALNLFGGTAEVTGGSFTGTDNEYGDYSGTPFGEWTVDIDEGASLILKGGDFPNGFVVDETTANAFLAEDYYYKDADGKFIDVADDAKIINGYVKVSKGADFANAVITLDSTELTYNGSEIKPTVIVTVGGKTLTEGKDYNLTFANNVNVGKATVTVTGAGDYTGQATKAFKIVKADITVTAAPTPNTLTYKGEAQNLISAGEANFGTMVYSLDGAEYSETIPQGTDAGDYTVYYKVIGDSNHNDTEPATVTVTINAKDISDGSIILGDPLTYNGTEQTQTVEKVIPTGTAPEATFTVSGNKATNVGVYLLTVTGTGNFTGEAKIAFEIAPDTTSIDALTVDNVTSANKADIEAVKAQIDNAVTDLADDETKNEWADIKEACEDMLRVINSIELSIADVEEDYAGFSEDTVKSSDIPALDEIVSKVNEIKDRYSFNLTDEEEKKLEDILDGIEKLKAKIDETADEIARIDEAVNGYDKETVTSDDVPELGKLIEDIKALTDGDNLTEDEKAALEETDKAIDDLVEKLAEVAEEIKRVDEAVKSYDEETVKSTDSEDLSQLKEDIQSLIDNNNTTENEKTALEELIKDIEGLEDKIDETENQLDEIAENASAFNSANITDADVDELKAIIKAIDAVNTDNLTEEQKAEIEAIRAEIVTLLKSLSNFDAAIEAVKAKLVMFSEERVTIFWEEDINALIAEIDALLAEENMNENDKATLNGCKAQAEHLIEVIKTPKEYISARFFYFIWDCVNWKIGGLSGWLNSIIDILIKI